ncbi:MAG: hypothetical protein PHP00_03125 [Thiotrichaceae bacterium]|nr:hypothetical protein [Thiotrichaceae bacterium]
MKAIAILHEGNPKKTHDNDLIYQLMEHLHLNVELVDFYGMSCKSNFFNPDYRTYSAPGLLKQLVEDGHTKKILFVVDADHSDNDKIFGSYENTQRELNNIIEILGFSEISHTYIMCDPETKIGYLESFILATIPNPQRQCIERFLDCSEFPSKENHKAILHNIYKLAYPAAPYDFEHAYFDELKDKLRSLFDSPE